MGEWWFLGEICVLALPETKGLGCGTERIVWEQGQTSSFSSLQMSILRADLCIRYVPTQVDQHFSFDTFLKVCPWVLSGFFPTPSLAKCLLFHWTACIYKLVLGAWTSIWEVWASEQGLMQSNRLLHFCWLNVNEDLHSLWLEENLGLLWFSFSSATYSHGLFFSHTVLSLRGRTLPLLRYPQVKYRATSRLLELTQLLLILLYYLQDIKKTVLQYNVGHSQETLGPHPGLSNWWFLKQAGVELLLALGKLSTWVFALQNCCLLLVQPNGALLPLKIKPLEWAHAWYSASLYFSLPSSTWS